MYISQYNGEENRLGALCHCSVRTSYGELAKGGNCITPLPADPDQPEPSIQLRDALPLTMAISYSLSTLDSEPRGGCSCVKCMLPTNLILDPRDVHSRTMLLTFYKDSHWHRAPCKISKCKCRCCQSLRPS